MRVYFRKETGKWKFKELETAHGDLDKTPSFLATGHASFNEYTQTEPGALSNDEEELSTGSVVAAHLHWLCLKL